MGHNLRIRQGITNYSLLSEPVWGSQPVAATILIDCRATDQGQDMISIPQRVREAPRRVAGAALLAAEDAEADPCLQQQADKLSAMDTIAVSEGEDLDRQLAAISQKTEVDSAMEALKARLSESGSTSPAAPAKQKDKISSAFEE